MPPKKRKKRGLILKKFKQNERRLKGKLFEVVLAMLLGKAGFNKDFESSQITRNRNRLHGRGGTYDPDFFGVFKLGIPFVNPLFLVVEAKHYRQKVTLKYAREFLGCFYDFSQFAKINTKTGGDKRYDAIYETRFTYCPILFSTRGFQKSAIGLMYAHGIGFISHESSAIIEKINSLMEEVMRRIEFHRLVQADFEFFRNLDTLEKLKKVKAGYSAAVSRLVNFVSNIYSFIAVIDLKFPIQVLGKRKLPFRLPSKVKIESKADENYRLKTSTNRIIGDFSFSDNFLEDYIRQAKKKNRTGEILKTVDIVIPRGEVMEIKQFLIDDNTRNTLLNKKQ